MALFDDNTNLEDILGQKADSASMDISNQFAKKRRQAVSEQAHAGRLGSGVANYTMGDINADELGQLGDVQSSLANALGGVPADSFVQTRESDRNRQLAELIAKLSKPSALEQELGLMGGGAKAIGSFF